MVATANSFSCHCVAERDHISLLKGCEEALEQKGNFFWLLGDDSDMSTDFLHQLWQQDRTWLSWRILLSCIVLLGQLQHLE